MKRRHAALATLCLLAAGLRLQGLHWDGNRWRPPGRETDAWQEHHLHPDERFLTLVTARVQVPETLAEYLDTSKSPLNPNNQGFGFFVYGTLPVLLVKWAGGLLGIHGQAAYEHIHLVGRVVSAVFDVATVMLCWALGRRLFGERAALGGALLYALAVLPIQQAHFFTVDSIATTFVVATLVAADSVRRRGRLLDYTLAGLALGVATACKLSAAPAVVVVAAACAVRIWLDRSDAERVAHVVLGAAGSAVVALLAFRLLLPYAFAGPGLLDVGLNGVWLKGLRTLENGSSGAVAYPPGYQWAGRIPLWFPWKHMVLAGMGPVLGVAAWVGWALGGWQLFRRGRAEHLVPWVWVAAGFAFYGTRWVMTMRYFLPLYPVLCLYAAWLVARVAETRADSDSEPRSAARRRWANSATILAAAILGGTALWTAAFSAIYWRPHSRITASRWIYEHVAQGSTLALEHWDDVLPLTLERRPQDVYRFVQLASFEEDQPAKLDGMIVALDQADYVVMSSARVMGPIMRLPERFPMTARYYRALVSGQLGFELAADVTSYPALGPLAIPDDRAEEAFTVYDHPRVRLFRKTSRWNPDAARRLLGDVDWSAVDRRPPRELRPAD